MHENQTRPVTLGIGRKDDALNPVPREQEFPYYPQNGLILLLFQLVQLEFEDKELPVRGKYSQMRVIKAEKIHCLCALTRDCALLLAILRGGISRIYD
jgi:hypothetical protein